MLDEVAALLFNFAKFDKHLQLFRQILLKN